MKSAMKRAAGGVALTMVLIRGFCGGGVFLGYLGIEGLLQAQASFVTPEATDQEASSERCSLDDGDVERNADLYVFNHEVAHG